MFKEIEEFQEGKESAEKGNWITDFRLIYFLGVGGGEKSWKFKESLWYWDPKLIR